VKQFKFRNVSDSSSTLLGRTLILRSFSSTNYACIFCMKVCSKPNCKQRKVAQMTFVQKMCVLNADEIDSWYRPRALLIFSSSTLKKMFNNNYVLVVCLKQRSQTRGPQEVLVRPADLFHKLYKCRFAIV